MTLHTPYIMQQTVADNNDEEFSAQEIRMYMTAVGGALDGQGVYNPGDLKVTQRGAGANFSVDVAAGICAVVGDDVVNQGIYYAWSDAVANIATPGAPGSGTRIHRLVAQVRDKLHNGAYSTYDWVISLLQDTGGGTPAEPASAVTLALVTIAAGQVSVTNANISDQRLVWNDVWHDLTPIISTWSLNGGLPVSGYRLVPGQPSQMDFIASLNQGTAARSDGTTIGTMPAGYRPSNNYQRIMCGTNNWTTARTDGAAPYLQFDTAGVITIQGMPAVGPNGSAFANGRIRLT